MSASTESVSRRLATFVATARYHDLPTEAVEETRRSILDWLGSTLAGSLEPPARMVQQIVAGLGRSDQATVFGAERSSAPGAALANGVAAHILELDDVHKGSTLHPAAPIIPAALAVAEREGADGRDFILAVALGYEVGLRIGEAVNPSHYRFWHPTGTAATFGAAAAAGYLLGLDPDRMLHALGSAGTQAAGLWEFNADGAMSKHLHPGKAAMNGVLAADLARVGFTGASRILEGPRGFFQATSTEADPSRITDGLGTRWKVTENCYKLHACCGHTHSAIDLALDLRDRAGWSDEVAERAAVGIELETYGPGYAIVSEPNPRTPYQAKFSLAYCVATALIEGRVGLEQFSADRFGAEGVRHRGIARLLERTRITVADDLTAKYPAAWPSRILVRLADGSELRGNADYPRGNPENPVPNEILAAKFAGLVEPRLGIAYARRGVTFVHQLDKGVPVRAAVEDLVAADRLVQTR